MTFSMEIVVVPVLPGKGAYQENVLRAAPAALAALLNALFLKLVQVAVRIRGFAQSSCNCHTCVKETLTAFVVPVSLTSEVE